MWWYTPVVQAGTISSRPALGSWWFKANNNNKKYLNKIIKKQKTEEKKRKGKDTG